MKRFAIALILFLMLASQLTSQTRTLLTGDQTFYASTAGSDSNDCDADDPCLTPQHVVDIVSSYDLGSFNATVHISDGTYNSSICIAGLVGSSGSSLTIEGNPANPANVSIQQGIFVETPNSIPVRLKGLTLSKSGNGVFAAGSALSVIGGAMVTIDHVNFGSAPFAHIYATYHTVISCTTAYSISAGSQYHIYFEQFAGMEFSGATITITAPVQFSGQFARILWQCSFLCANCTFINKSYVTGQRYYVARNGIIDTNYSGSSYLPGTIAGIQDTGGQYI